MPGDQLTESVTVAIAGPGHQIGVVDHVTSILTQLTPPEPTRFPRCPSGMTTRRNLLTAAGAGALLTMVGCGRGTSTAPVSTSAAPDVVLLDAQGGAAALRAGRIDPLGTAVAAPSGGTIYTVRRVGADTDLVAVATRSGQATGTTRLRGAWVPAVVGSSGSRVALLPAGSNQGGSDQGDYGGAVAGRARTSVLVVGAGPAPQRLDLAGNYVPDAFSSEGQGLFVLDWQPATAPDHYRVREITIADGAASPVLGRDKQPIPADAEEQMRGERRTAVFSPGYDVLYTLYTHQPGSAGWNGDDSAFIHTLHLTQHWAHCIDLPAPFGLDPHLGHALAIAPDGSRLYVVDAAGGRLAAVDTEGLTLLRSVALAAMPGTAYAVATGTDVVVGVNNQLRLVDRDSLAARAHLTLPAPLRGLVTSPDGARIYLGLPGAVQWRDAASLALLGTVAVAGLTGLRAAL